MIGQALHITTYTDHPAAIAVRVPHASVGHAVRSPLLLRPTEDGWSLLSTDGVVVLRGFGLASRRQCLEYARSLGVLTVIS